MVSPPFFSGKVGPPFKNYAEISRSLLYQQGGRTETMPALSDCSSCFAIPGAVYHNLSDSSICYQILLLSTLGVKICEIGTKNHDFRQRRLSSIHYLSPYSLIKVVTLSLVQRITISQIYLTASCCCYLL